MNNIPDRFAAIAGRARGCALAIVGCVWVAGSPLVAQSALAATPPKAGALASLSGCVQKAPGDATSLVISMPTVCARLSGKLSVDRLAGHQVDLKGVLTPRTSAADASIQVDSVINVGKSCTDVCSLQPPGTRGLQRPSNSAIPGSEGGTPGAVAHPPH